jgi:hypothetical protein
MINKKGDALGTFKYFLKTSYKNFSQNSFACKSFFGEKNM